ncbi:type II toxin-antitoxin system Phd/YefM family antitoxin [Actinomyces sp. Z16]|nr:type II toxin-antitoxin system prevent-host-death family antitoxin [Actinomyces sp. Z16]
MTTIPHRELRNDSAAILRRVEAGESFEITNNGRPVAELVPITHDRFALLRRQRATRPAVPTDFNALKHARPQFKRCTGRSARRAMTICYLDTSAGTSAQRSARHGGAACGRRDQPRSCPERALRPTPHLRPGNATRCAATRADGDRPQMIDSQGTAGLRLEVPTHLERLVRALRRSK